MVAICSEFFVQSVTAGVIFDCVFDEFEFELEIGIIYECNGEVIPESSETTDLIMINGDHFPRKSNADVGGLRIFNQIHLTFIPTRLEDFFPRLKVIELWNSGVTSISVNNLRPFPDLLQFKVMAQKIVSVPSELFKYNLKLRYIRFDGNPIARIGHDLVTHLDDLSILSFERNPCIDRSAYSRTEIVQLNAILPIQCPPRECFCLDEIESVHSRISQQIDDQIDATGRLEDKVTQNFESHSEEIGQISRTLDDQSLEVERILQKLDEQSEEMNRQMNDLKVFIIKACAIARTS